MKRELLESVKAIPYTLEQVVDRLGALSAVLGISVTSATDDAQATVTVTHADASDGTFEAVPDERIFLEDTIVERDSTGKFVRSIATMPVVTGDLLNVDIDLLGCKQFVKVAVTYDGGASPSVTAAYALTLGDNHTNPPD